ncbi:nuclear transport factor 2 family protein [Undibacterium sp.]|uniref:nuclear transport factor 2 family protein n=1 Tax=Undibacterium sp. TaxID=1914977 RepID=UPI00273141D5|nr:nuclear transport factor 2 family protein [Undibacterium sp.]MDP1979511.1 nuclear transport factor 2 family protein [Undibacterium sp.]
MLIKILKVITLSSAVSFIMLPAHAFATEDMTVLAEKVTHFIDEWHDDAAHARLQYFDKIAKDGIYIGTDKTERWTRDEFKVWAKRFFERQSAWAFKSFNRHISMSEDRKIIWFDEQLQTQMGICQATGVIAQTAKGFEIRHYQLSLTVPNELTDYLAAGVKKLDEKNAGQVQKK